ILEAFEPILARIQRRGGHELSNAEFAHAAEKFGLNIRPGGDDDGWHEVPPVDLPDGTQLHLYKDGEALGRIMEMVRQAKHQVLVETYIWSDDATGNAFAETLADLAGRGVKVFAIYDGLGSLLSGRKPFETMRAAGVQLIEFHPPLPWRCRRSWRVFNRDHRKLFVIDNEIAGLGGLNIGDRYAGRWVSDQAMPNPAAMWRDAGVGIVGPGARVFAQAFAATWDYCLSRGGIDQTLFIDGIDVPPPAKGDRLGKVREGETSSAEPEAGKYPEDVLQRGCDLAVMATAPTFASPLRPFLYRLLRDARRRIDLTMAYFAPDDELIEGLCRAAKRGVRVR
ncbi:MAG: phospholipase D-like domain-containing protein, partial [Planctomycetota bacterium]